MRNGSDLRLVGAKKVLIISCNTPPFGGVKTHRLVTFARHLKRFGWEPVILTTREPTFGNEYVDSFAGLSEGIQVVRIRDPLGVPMKFPPTARNDLSHKSGPSSRFSGHGTRWSRQPSLLQRIRTWNGSVFKRIGIPDRHVLWAFRAAHYPRAFSIQAESGCVG